MKDKAQLIVDEIEADKAAAETKLEAAKPALEAAEAALQVCHTHTESFSASRERKQGCSHDFDFESLL